MKTSTKIKTRSNAPSVIVKDETEYSIPWKPVNIIAKTIVKIKPYNAPLLLPCIRE